MDELGGNSSAKTCQANYAKMELDTKKDDPGTESRYPVLPRFNLLLERRKGAGEIQGQLYPAKRSEYILAESVWYYGIYIVGYLYGHEVYSPLLL
jgi:hypothetical protein